ncbi:MAG: sulfite exporter TauE/SafE family protein [Colwellia sp.]|nr:sulfite exporter TauE/SafE family protein [Colwellia sp.]
MLIDPTLLVIALIVVIAGSTLQSMSGLGLAVIASPILILISPNYLPAPILALGCILSLLNCIRYRHQLHFKNIRLALLGRVPGSLLGVILLVLLPPKFFAVCFSLFILLSVLLSYRHSSIAHCSRNLFIAGFCSGLMGTTTSVGAPPIALVYQNSKVSTARAELGLFFLVGTLMSLVLLLISGNINYQQLQLTLPLIPAVFIGFGLSLWLDKYFKQVFLKPLIATLSVVSCSIILLKTFLYS